MGQTLMFWVIFIFYGNAVTGVENLYYADNIDFDSILGMIPKRYYYCYANFLQISCISTLLCRSASGFCKKFVQFCHNLP